MASGTNKNKRNKGTTALRAARAGVVKRREVPWGTIIGVVVVLALAAAVFGYYLVKSAPQREQESREETAAEQFTPSRQNQDPSKKIDGVVIKEYKHRGHVNSPKRVAYDQTPPFGGPHDIVWATCNGNIYPEPVRTEHMVHALEHGAIWITYDPKKVDDETRQQLELRVKNKPYMLMSPYPNMDSPISLQSWGHQLKVSDADDQRIDNFIAALRQNQYLTPEPNGSCDPAPGFDPDNPPKFDPSKPGKDAAPMTFEGQQGQMPEAGGQPGAGGEEQ
ncbi:DUF3105 domain-containing protein [Thermocrispum municipale]|jgi:hypothetical protein|uniref:DUF3105 domain-containing protein n=1 Tax=Thermocrispum agreste TaxID=37925 RepID=A0ABD6FJ45_9PSEU|nr:DUF3105 domain-containing protein [Thermocrispum municipale]